MTEAPQTSPTAAIPTALVIGLPILTLFAGPLLACALTTLWPGMADERFISAMDGSTGPAFYFCVTIWAVVWTLGFSVSVALVVARAVGQRRSR